MKTYVNCCFDSMEILSLSPDIKGHPVMTATLRRRGGGQKNLDFCGHNK